MRALTSYKWSIAVGVFLALIFTSLAPLIVHQYNESMPVVDMSAKVVGKSPDAVVLHITGEKLRMCRFVDIKALTQTPTGALVDAYLERLSKIPDQGTRPVGRFDLGLWRVWPIEGSLKALVYVQHDCDGAVMLSKIAEVDL